MFELLNSEGARILAIASLAAAQSADIISTRRALRLPGLREANPVVAWLMQKLGGAWWIAKAILAIGSAAAAFHVGAIWAVFAINIATASVAYRNFKLIKAAGQ